MRDANCLPQQQLVQSSMTTLKEIAMNNVYDSYEMDNVQDNRVGTSHHSIARTPASPTAVHPRCYPAVRNRLIVREEFNHRNERSRKPSARQSR